MKGLQVSPTLTMPLDAVTETFWFLGKRGSGKTHNASVFVEELLKARLQVVVIDPMHAWYGLRSSIDGKSPGLPIAIFGGPRGDIPLEPEAGVYMADLAMGERISMILDVKDWSKAARRRFVTDFVARLLARNDEPMHTVIEEAPLFAPRVHGREDNTMVGVMEEFVRLGRGSGCGVSLISQRSATLHPEVRAQTEVLVAHRVRAPLDVKAALEWFDLHDPDRAREAAASLPHLETGTALISSTEFLNHFGPVTFRARETFDSSATPKVGQKIREARTFADIDLAAIKEQMSETIEKAKADDPKELRRTIAELRRQLAARPTEKVVETVVERVEVPVLSDVAVASLGDVMQAVGSFGGLIERALREWGSGDHDRQDVPGAGRAGRRTRPVEGHAARAAAAGGDVVAAPAQAGRSTQRADPPRRRDPRLPSVPGAAPSDVINEPRQKILDAIAWYETVGVSPVSRSHTAFVAGTSPNSSGYEKNLGALRTAGLVDYPAGGMLALTPAGASLARASAEISTTGELITVLESRLGKPKGRILRAVVDAYPDALSRDDLADLVDVSPQSSGFEKNLGGLRSLGLVDYPQRGYVVAGDVLFIEGGQ